MSSVVAASAFRRATSSPSAAAAAAVAGTAALTLASSATNSETTNSRPSSPAWCQSPSTSTSPASHDSDAAAARDEDGRRNAPSLDMKAIMGDGSSSREEVAGRARRGLDAKFGEMYEKHPCGGAMRGWHRCVLDEMAKTDPSDAGPAPGQTVKEAGAAQRTKLHRLCADPHLLSLVTCLKDEQLKLRKRIVDEVGEKKFQDLLYERESDIMSQGGREGYDYIRLSKEADARTEAVAEAFRRREGMAAPGEEEGKGEEGGKSSSTSQSAENEMWFWEKWKADSEEGIDRGSDTLTEERKEELRADADAILESVERARKEREARQTPVREKEPVFDDAGGGEGRGGGKRWWRFGF